MIYITLQKFLKTLSILNLHQLGQSHLQHLHNHSVNGLLASEEEKVEHHFAQSWGRVVVAHHRVVNLTERTEDVKSVLVNDKLNIRKSLCDFLL